MRFMRPLVVSNYFHRWPLAPKGYVIAGQAPVARSRTVAMFGLGELGDEMGMMTAMPEMIAQLKSLIIANTGPTYAGSLANNQSLPAIIYAASLCYDRAGSGGLGEEAQRYWQSFQAQAEPATSPNNIAWVLARCINRWADKLIASANEQINSGMILDAAASRCVYTLMDTTQQGTTWIGGTVTTSKLDNSQWGAVFEVAFNAIAKGVATGVLPFTYLNVLIKAFCVPQVTRRFPVWSPPYANLVQLDPRAAAFRTVLKQLGWGSAVKLWFTYTQQAWVEQDAAWEATDQAYMGAITALNYVSGKAIYDQIAEKVQDYFSARADAINAIQQFQQMQSGPLASSIPASDIAAMDAIKKQFSDTDMTVNNALAPAGLWPSDTQAGLSFLGIAQIIVGGVIAIGILGMIVWAISIMTQTSRTAAAQTKATADNILSTIDQVKASAQRVYDASAKTPADEKTYQDSLLATQQLAKLIPKPPDGSDPLGLKWIALAGMVAIGGLFAWKAFKKH